MKVLSEALKMNTQLFELELQSEEKTRQVNEYREQRLTSQFTGCSLGVEGVKALNNALNENTNIRKLYIWGEHDSISLKYEKNKTSIS